MNPRRWTPYLVLAGLGALGLMAMARSDTTYTVTSPGQPEKTMTQVDHATELVPPCQARIYDSLVEIEDSKSQELDIEIKGQDIVLTGYEDGPPMAPGGPDDVALLGLLKQWLAGHYDASLEQYPEFPYVLGREDKCTEQLATQHLIRLLQERIERKAIVDPQSIEFLPHESERREVAGMKLLGPGWREVSRVSELQPPCTFLHVDSLTLDEFNFHFVLADPQQHLLRVSYGGQKLFLGQRKMTHPGDSEETALQLMIRDAFEKMYEPAFDTPTPPPNSGEGWHIQRLLKMALTMMDLRCKNKAEVPDVSVENDSY